MTEVEYRIEYIQFDEGPHAETVNAQLVSKLNEWGRQGWRVVHVELAQHGEPASSSRPVLLERAAGSEDGGEVAASAQA